MSDFIGCLEHYSEDKFRNDLEYVRMGLLEPIFKQEKKKAEKRLMQNKNESSSDEDDEKESGRTFDGIALDSEGRNVYELFEDILGDCDVEKCAIYERYTRSRDEATFWEKINKYYALNGKGHCIDERQYQELFDGFHVCLFHSSARYQGIGLANSEAHRRFLQYSREHYQKLRATRRTN